MAGTKVKRTSAPASDILPQQTLSTIAARLLSPVALNVNNTRMGLLISHEAYLTAQAPEHDVSGPSGWRQPPKDC